MNIRAWLHKHSLKLLAIRDTPEAIAGGVAIGIFLGFTPLFGFKTLLAIFLAWLTGSNILAAVIAGTLHDLILPLMPAIFLWEYGIGSWLLSHPHRWPGSVIKLTMSPQAWLNWSSFVTIGTPMLLGSVVCGVPLALATFLVARRLIVRHRLKHSRRLAGYLMAGKDLPADESENAS